MRHIKPISKAELEWSSDDILDIITFLVQVISVVLPTITAIIEAKQTPETTT